LFLLEDKSLNSKICAVYFACIGCSNCAAVAPLVLIEWLKNTQNWLFFYNLICVIPMAIIVFDFCDNFG